LSLGRRWDVLGLRQSRALLALCCAISAVGLAPSTAAGQTRAWDQAIADFAEQLTTERLVPALLLPISRQIASSNA